MYGFLSLNYQEKDSDQNQEQQEMTKIKLNAGSYWRVDCGTKNWTVLLTLFEKRDEGSASCPYALYQQSESIHLYLLERDSRKHTIVWTVFLTAVLSIDFDNF